MNVKNNDDSFTVADTNFFLSPYEIHPKAQENIYLVITLKEFAYLNMNIYTVCIHSNRLIEAILLITLNKPIIYKKKKKKKKGRKRRRKFEIIILLL